MAASALAQLGSPQVPKDPCNEQQLWLVKGQLITLPGEEFEAAFAPLAEILKNDKPVTRETFVGWPSWKQLRAVKALAKVPPFKYEFPHGKVTPFDFLQDCDWTQVRGVQRSAEGSEGVLFVELADNQALVVKAPQKVAAEMCGNKLCKRLGINCPNMRMVSSNSAEGRLMAKCLIDLDSKRQESDRRVEKMLAKKHGYLIIEYLDATPLANIFSHGEMFVTKDSLNKHGTDQLANMGRLICFDMLINNYDRLPCIWDNKGNPGNVMFMAASNEVASIDNMMSCLNESIGPNFKNYLNKIRTVINEVARARQRSSRSVHPNFDKVRLLLKDGCSGGTGWPGLGIDVGEAGTNAVQDGFMDMLDLICYGDDTSPALSRAELEEMKAAVVIHLHLEQEDGRTDAAIEAAMLQDGCEAIDIEFMHRIIEIFREECEAAGQTDQAEPAVLLEHVPDIKVMMKGKTRNLEADVLVDADGAETCMRMAMAKDKRPEGIRKLLCMLRSGLVTMRACATRKQTDAIMPAVVPIFPLAKLACKKPWPEGVHPSSRKNHLSDDEFHKVFNMSKDAFSVLAEWRKIMLKKEANLF